MTTNCLHVISVIIYTQCGQTLHCCQLMLASYIMQIWFTQITLRNYEVLLFTLTDNPLTTGDLATVQNTIWEARVHWYNLGLGLGIAYDSLEAIKLANQRAPDHCFRDMLLEWLKREDPKPTWGALVEALRSPSVGLSHLASQI